MSRIDLIVLVFWGLFKESPPLVESINMKEGFYAIIWSSSCVWLRIILLIIFGGLTSTFMKLVEDWLLDDLLLFSLIVGAVLMSRKWEIKWSLSFTVFSSPLLLWIYVGFSLYIPRMCDCFLSLLHMCGLLWGWDEVWRNSRAYVRVVSSSRIPLEVNLVTRTLLELF